MRMTTIYDEQARMDFAQRAAKHFSDNPHIQSYTDGEIVAGCLFALRMGLGKDCVLVFQLDEFFEPTNYQNIVDKNED